jgi:hypothetical protein
MEKILKRLEKAEQALALVREELRNTKDGFFYSLKECHYGVKTNTEVLNLKVASEICNHYNGDNGFVELTTDNPKALELDDDNGCIVIIIEKITKH